MPKCLTCKHFKVTDAALAEYRLIGQGYIAISCDKDNLLLEGKSNIHALNRWGCHGSNELEKNLGRNPPGHFYEPLEDKNTWEALKTDEFYQDDT